MLTLWVIIGCIFFIGLGMRFVYKVLGLTKIEAITVYLTIIAIILINSAPARTLISLIM